MPWQGSVLKQPQMQSCGYCCVGMVINLIEGGSVQMEEQSLVAAGKQLDPQAYDRATFDRVGMQPTPIVHAAYQQKGKLPHFGSGTYGQHLAALLRRFQVNAKYGTGSVKSAMRGVTAGKPLIALVQWKKGGGHWVVVSGRGKHFGRASDYAILDPGGYAFDNKGSTDYKPPYNQEGKFANYYVQVLGRLRTDYKKVGKKLPGM